MNELCEAVATLDATDQNNMCNATQYSTAEKRGAQSHQETFTVIATNGKYDDFAVNAVQLSGIPFYDLPHIIKVLGEHAFLDTEKECVDVIVRFDRK